MIYCLSLGRRVEYLFCTHVDPLVRRSNGALLSRSFVKLRHEIPLGMPGRHVCVSTPTKTLLAMSSSPCYRPSNAAAAVALSGSR